LTKILRYVVVVGYSVWGGIFEVRHFHVLN